MEFADSDLPAIYQGVDGNSTAAQKRVLMALTVSLTAVVVAAGFGAVSLRSGSIDWAGVVASVALLVATLSTVWLLWAKPEQEWYDARAAAESMKTLSWQYAIGGGEFPIDAEAEGAMQARFMERLRDMTEGLEQLHHPPVQDESELPPGMAALRGSSIDQRRSAYLEGRIRDQLSWYSQKAGWNESRYVAWTAVTVVLLGAGLLFGVGKAFFDLEVDLLGPAAAAAASAMAWVRSKDFAELAAAYNVTAGELKLIEAEAEAEAAATGSELRWASFVERAELAISREHTLWKARRGGPRMGL